MKWSSSSAALHFTTLLVAPPPFLFKPLSALSMTIFHLPHFKHQSCELKLSLSTPKLQWTLDSANRVLHHGLCYPLQFGYKGKLQNNVTVPVSVFAGDLLPSELANWWVALMELLFLYMCSQFQKKIYKVSTFMFPTFHLPPKLSGKRNIWILKTETL